MHLQYVLLPNKPTDDHFLASDGQHDSTIQPYVWHVPPVLSPYPDASEGTGPPKTGCWIGGHGDWIH